MPATSSKTPPKHVNVAVVGLGFMGTTHLRAYLTSSLARVVAVCGVSRLPVNGVLPGITGNILKSDAIDVGAHVKVYEKLDELLADPEVHAVDVCTPTSLHKEQVIAALRGGKHVLCEKPLARSAAAAREILEVAANSAGMLMPAMCMRFWPGWSWLKKMVAEQEYGRVLAADFRRMSAMPSWGRGTYSDGNDSGGALFDLHIHDTDFVNFLFGRPASVYSSGVNSLDGPINHVVTQYHYPGGPSVYAEGSWLLTQGFQMAYTVHCERATIDYDSSRGGDSLLIQESGQPPRVLKPEGTDGYAAEISYFLSCVANGRSPGIVTAHDGLVALEICEAEEQSVRTNTIVKL